MKLRALRNINIRSDHPHSKRGGLVGTINKGAEIEVVATAIEDKNCEEIEGNKKWYQIAGCNLFMWSGGFEEMVVRPPQSTVLNTIIDYGKLLELPADLRTSKGKGIKVFILDSGIYENHPDFAGHFMSAKKTPSQDFTKSPFGTSDMYGHGTHVAGLIGSRTMENEGILGIAPECELINFKILDDETNGSSRTTTKLALEYILSQNFPPSVINLSFELPGIRFFEIEDVFKKTLKEGHVIVAAAGNDGHLLGKELYYPAQYPGIISVGSVIKKLTTNKDRPFPENLDYIVPCKDVSVLSENKLTPYTTAGYTSMATALISGLTALILKEHGTMDSDNVKVELNNLASPFNINSDYSILKIFKP